MPPSLENGSILASVFGVVWGFEWVKSVKWDVLELWYHSGTSTVSRSNREVVTSSLITIIILFQSRSSFLLQRQSVSEV